MLDSREDAVQARTEASRGAEHVTDNDIQDLGSVSIGHEGFSHPYVVL